MKRISPTLAMVGCTAIIAPIARAQMPPPPTDQTVAPVELVPAQPVSRNRVRISYQMGLNITANFKHLGGFAPQSNPGPAAGTAVNRTYDNGYNLVDISGNAGGQTWYWGYADNSSLQGNQLVLDSSASLANGVSRDNSSDPQHGFEIALDHELYRHPTRDWRFGIEGAFGYISGERKLDANVFGFRLGPYVELPLNDRSSLMVGGGLFLAVADTDFSYHETVTIPNVGTQTYSGSGGQTDVLIGGYVGANVEYALTKQVGLFAGARFQGAGSSVTQAQGRQAILNLNESVIVSVGASYSF
ncbi:MAG: hypothetical protein P8018_14205 [Acidobacteriota bacterium]